MVREVDKTVFGEEDSSSGHIRARLRQKSWHPVVHVSLLKKYHQVKKNLNLWHEDLMPPSEYELWDGAVSKAMTMHDSRHIHGHRIQYKYLMHEYSPYEYE